ncbi:hypothetical protein ABMA27_000173 [Loxostege sticticalis]|uniref:Uncharacterized protein n=1 Tax=Loxostege sticticalis TaxID=481309 RepID=A0ABR3IMF9_LOXSC
MAKPGLGSEVVIMDEGVLASQMAREMPHVTSLSVTKSSRVHVGPKIVHVNQTVQNKEMIKDLPFHKYLWSIIKNTSKAERMSCLAATAALIICILLIVYYTMFVRYTEQEPLDIAPHPWNITREMWLADDNVNNSRTTESYEPLKLVIIQHTVSAECHFFTDCSAAVRKLQEYFLTNKDLGYDIPYNFLIGNDGRVYEGRGWKIEGAHTFRYNRCSLGIGFIGDYRTTKVLPSQIERLNLLLEEGVARGHLDPKYYIVPARDLQNTESPGINLYNAIKEWDTYDHEHKFRNRTCDEIYGRV